MSLTYSELKTAIQDYTQNTETTFVNNLDIFIRGAEERILKNVQLTIFRRNQTAAFTAGDEYLACPSDYLAPYSLSYEDANGDKQFLLFKDVTFVEEYNPDDADEADPVYYAHFDEDNFIVAPTPSAARTVELHYFYRPTSLVDSGDSGTTWLSTNAEFAMLYGALYEAYIFMKGEQDVLEMYNSRFQEALLSLKNFGESKEIRDTYRTGMVVRDRV